MAIARAQAGSSRPPPRQVSRARAAAFIPRIRQCHAISVLGARRDTVRRARSDSAARCALCNVVAPAQPNPPSDMTCVVDRAMAQEILDLAQVASLVGASEADRAAQQWLAVPLWFPPGKDSVPADSGAFRSQFCGREIVNASRPERVTGRYRLGQSVLVSLESTHRTRGARRAAGLRSTRTECPNLLAHYFYLWETTVVWQAIETAWVSASLGGSYWSQQRQLAASHDTPDKEHGMIRPEGRSRRGPAK
jgi:hypothetical protein